MPFYLSDSFYADLVEIRRWFRGGRDAAQRRTAADTNQVTPPGLCVAKLLEDLTAGKTAKAQIYRFDKQTDGVTNGGDRDQQSVRLAPWAHFDWGDDDTPRVPGMLPKETWVKLELWQDARLWLVTDWARARFIFATLNADLSPGGSADATVDWPDSASGASVTVWAPPYFTDPSANSGDSSTSGNTTKLHSGTKIGAAWAPDDRRWYADGASCDSGGSTDTGGGSAA